MPWNVDNDLSKILWSVRYLGIATVQGRFTDLHAELQIDSENPLDWRTDVSMNAASVYSGYEALDNHLRSADHLDVERYPTIEFHSSGVELLGSGALPGPQEKMPGVVTWEPHADHLCVKGDLTLHGVTRPVELDTWYFGQATDPRQKTRRAFSARMSIHRSDFNIYVPPQIDPTRVIVGEVVTLTLEIIATQVHP